MTSGAHELALLRLRHLMLTEQIVLSEDERREVGRVTRPSDPSDRLGVSPEASVSVQREATLAHLETWRARTTHPLTSRADVEASAIVVRTYEELFAELDA